MLKKISILALSLALFLSIAPLTNIFAAEDPTLDSCIGEDGSTFNTLCDLSTGSVGKVVGYGVNILFIVAIVVALFFLIFGGIKWITSGGDKAQLETARNTIIAAVIGLILVFSSFFLLNITLNFFGLGSVNKFSVPSLKSDDTVYTCRGSVRGSCPAGESCISIRKASGGREFVCR